MPSHQFQQLLSEAEVSVSRLSTFDIQSLVQEAELGAKQNFREALSYASRSVAFARLINTESLKDLPEPYVGLVRDQMNSVFNLFDRILKYSPEQGTSLRQQLINEVEASYHQLFRELLPILSFSIGRTADFKRLGRVFKIDGTSLRRRNRSWCMNPASRWELPEPVWRGLKKLSVRG